jgi:L-alanine-DL-glutamate epimerase-like enolase superfamily enzyme
MAVSAVDMALWDLKARLLGVPLVTLLGAARRKVPVYGSGGFTSHSLAELKRQLSGWAGEGIRRVKMRIGRDAATDPVRVRAAREAIGPQVSLFVDAGGAFTPRQAILASQWLRDYGVEWFEEPVRHDDFRGTRRVRDGLAAGIDLSGGEYGFNLGYFQGLLDAEAVDVLQADATRCGVTGFLQAAALCEARNLPMSSHGAPSVHAHLCAAAAPVRHLEYFQDHARIERVLFDGAHVPIEGNLEPDPSRPGLGIELKDADAAKYQIG